MLNWNFKALKNGILRWITALSTIGKFYKIIIFIHRIQNFIDLSHRSRFSRKRGIYFIRLYVEKMQNILKN